MIFVPNVILFARQRISVSDKLKMTLWECRQNKATKDTEEAGKLSLPSNA